MSLLPTKLSVACLLATAEAFTPVPVACTSSRAVARSSVPRCDITSQDASFNRRAVLAALLGTGIGAGAAPAFAGYVTSLGIETTKPEDADRDDDLLKTKEVQAAVKNLASYKTSAATLKATFDGDNNAVLIPSIRKEFDFSKVRDDLNVASTVFDDTTQLTVDRLSRSILYDLTELENAARFKKGEDQTRTPKKVANVQKWFAKLDTDLTTLLKYFA